MADDTSHVHEATGYLDHFGLSHGEVPVNASGTIEHYEGMVDVTSGTEAPDDMYSITVPKEPNLLTP